MLFGSPQFVQDAAVAALGDDTLTEELRQAYERRARLLVSELGDGPGARAALPEGGMFVLVDVRGTGLTGDEFALRLLEEQDVAVTPTDFGPSARGHVRVSLGADDERIEEAGRRLARLARGLAGGARPF